MSPVCFFSGDVGLFCGNTGLLCGDVRLFRHKSPVLGSFDTESCIKFPSKNPVWGWIRLHRRDEGHDEDEFPGHSREGCRKRK